MLELGLNILALSFWEFLQDPGGAIVLAPDMYWLMPVKVIDGLCANDVFCCLALLPLFTLD